MVNTQEPRHVCMCVFVVSGPHSTPWEHKPLHMFVLQVSHVIGWGV